ncbi:tetratricopeptide repeat protein [Granulicella tundricola]|uniref:Tetratricopeptide TPR_1 repeat-containing protein n=1 Tax=Granulicella tundricola (strain ATCC BAA-1859 / DSM 23138 / MP5ACTX9) TaxID=1198114 RepID=E8WYC7_GRATM|nr:tetratricopeptide repeat protein [Granulicella tundricola]ADW69833.1 Tetratricopeptide TPR_1 repeat-containing protein [Granulicella tundricola MP5ACTX9]
MLKPSFSRLLASSALLITALAAPLRSQAQASPSAADEKQPGGHVVLVLPFDNRSGNPNLNWIGDSFPDTLNQRLGSAGFLTISRDDRQFALDHLGLPVDFRPTRATTIRIAQTLDADYVIVGSFNTQGTGTNIRILVQAQVLEVNKLHLSQPLQDSSELPRLFDIENAIAWKVARQIEPGFTVAEQTFLSASAGIRLSAFENYIRGTSATASDERTKRLEVATLDAPTYAAAQLALGKQYYADRSYDKAAATLAHVPSSDRLSLEAGFYLGLSRFNAAKYAEAETAFAFVASRLPLPEVVNDQGVAQSRQNKDASALFQRAVTADPGDPDYHFNLAVATYKRGDFATASREIQAALKLRPNDNEFKQLQTLISAGRATKPVGDGFDPTTRLRRTYSEASFRQAAFQLDQMRSMRLATLPPKQQGAEYTQLGQDYMAQGLVPEAEEQFLSAIQADPSNATAHTGLAQVRQLSDSPDDARKEAMASIRLAPSVNAYIVLAKVDLQKNELAAASTDVQNALKLEPRNAAVLQLQQAIQAKSQAPAATPQAHP